MKRLLKGIALVVAMMTATTISAQDKVEATLGADVVSSYVWRGYDLGSASVQPSLGISWKGLSLGAWGAFGIVDKDDIKELDLTLSYNVAGLTVGITDYYCVSGAENAPGKYFRYKSGDKGPQCHVFEGNVGYDFGFASLNWFTNFAGDDDYASYCEIAVPFKLGVDWQFSAGILPYKTDFYGNEGFTCSNLSLKASKDIKITDHFSLPVFGQLTANPDNGKFYFAFGLSLGL